MNDVVEPMKFVKISDNTKFVGINREDEKSFRPGYVMEFAPQGSNVNIPVSDGFIGKEADEPFFIARSCYSSNTVVFSVSQLNNALASHGLTLELKEIPVEPLDSVEVMYQKSKAIGLCKHNPLVGHGKICSTCSYLGQCNADEVILERFNDGMEYCRSAINSEEE